MMNAAIFLAMTMLVSSLAGCVSIGIFAGDCNEAMVPAASGGSSFTYEGEGRFYSPALRTVLLDWSLAGGEQQAQLALDNITRIHIAIANETKGRTNAGGELIESWQSTYWAVRDGFEDLAAADEWLGSEHGEMIGVSDRNIGTLDGKIFEEVRAARGNTPGLLLAPTVWNRPFNVGPSEWENVHPLLTPAWIERESGVSSTSFDVENRSGTCILNIQSIHNDPSAGYASVVVEAVYHEGVPLPVEYSVSFPDNPASGDFSMSLSGWRLGEGQPLSGYEQGIDWPATAFQQDELEDGFLADRGDIFRVAFDEAVEASRESVESSQWFANNPGATPSNARYGIGSPDSSRIATWRIVWTSADGSDGIVTTVHFDEAPLADVVPQTGRTVFVEAGRGAILSDEQNWVTLRALSDFHAEVHGESIESLECDFVDQTCVMGTHHGRNLPYTDELGGSGFILSCIKTWMTEGLVLFDQCFDNPWVGPPVRVRSVGGS